MLSCSAPELRCHGMLQSVIDDKMRHHWSLRQLMSQWLVASSSSCPASKKRLAKVKDGVACVLLDTESLESSVSVFITGNNGWKRNWVASFSSQIRSQGCKQGWKLAWQVSRVDIKATDRDRGILWPDCEFCRLPLKFGCQLIKIVSWYKVLESTF